MNYLTLKEIEKKYNIKIPTLRDWIKKGKLEAHQFVKGKKGKIGKHGSPILVLETDIPTFVRNSSVYI